MLWCRASPSAKSFQDFHLPGRVMSGQQGKEKNDSDLAEGRQGPRLEKGMQSYEEIEEGISPKGALLLSPLLLLALGAM